MIHERFSKLAGHCHLEPLMIISSRQKKPSKQALEELMGIHAFHQTQAANRIFLHLSGFFVCLEQCKELNWIIKLSSTLSSSAPETEEQHTKNKAQSM
jgi:hypothetical protein